MTAPACHQGRKLSDRSTGSPSVSDGDDRGVGQRLLRVVHSPQNSREQCRRAVLPSRRLSIRGRRPGRVPGGVAQHCAFAAAARCLRRVRTARAPTSPRGAAAWRCRSSRRPRSRLCTPSFDSPAVPEAAARCRPRPCTTFTGHRPGPSATPFADRLIASNPAAGQHRQPESPEMPTWSAEQLGAFLQFVADDRPACTRRSCRSGSDTARSPSPWTPAATPSPQCRRTPPSAGRR